jgi:hypothetical protein
LGVSSFLTDPSKCHCRVHRTEIVLLQGDFLDVRGLRDWPAEADVVVANSTCFDDKV